MPVDTSMFKGRTAMAALAEARVEAGAAARADARAEDVLRLLDLRGVEVTEAERDLIGTCRDLELLDRWFAPAATAERIEDGLAGEGGA